MPLSRRRVTAAVTATALALIGAWWPDSVHRSTVGTEGPARHEDAASSVLGVGGQQTPPPDHAEPGTSVAVEIPSAAPPSDTDDRPSPVPLAEVGVSPSSTVAPVTTSTTSPSPEPEPPIGSPDLLGRLVFRGMEGLESMRPDGTDRRPEVRCPYGGDLMGGFDVSPDGRWVVQQCAEIDPATGVGGAFGLFRLYLQRTDGSQVRLLHGDGWGTRAPAWSPDGSSIAVQGETGLVLYDMAGEPTRLISVDFPVETDPEAARGRLRFSWAPDGRRIVFDNLYVLDLEHGTVARPEITGSRHADYSDATWSPDGEWIYVRAYEQSYFRDPPDEFQRVNTVDGTVEVLLEDLSWGPSGQMGRYSAVMDMGPPAFVEDGTMRFLRSRALWSMDLDGGDARILLDRLEGWQLATTISN